MTAYRNWLVRLLGGVSVAALAAASALATPANGTIVAGGTGGSIVPSGSDVTVNIEMSPRTVITWDSFNIDSVDRVVFKQLNNQSIALNKVTGPLAQSTIDGILQSNGHVWILNPAGVAFGANANVDVGALLATTADIDTATFMATDPTTGTFTFTDAGGTGAIIVANGADLDTTGLLALVAPMVTNAGDLTSSHGDVLLGGAEAFRIKFASTARDNEGPFDELLVTDFIIDGASTTVAGGADVVHQTSSGRSIGGRVIANASRMGGGAFLNMEGLVEAQDVGTLSGDVMLLGGVGITGGALGATATDAVKTNNMTIVAPGTATVQGTAVTIDTNTVGGASVTANVSLTATTGDITAGGDFVATTGAISMSAVNGGVDAGDLQAAGNITLTGQDIDIVGTNRSINSTGGTVSLTATGGSSDNISSTGTVDIDGDTVAISGALTGTSIDIDADNGTVTANAVTATGGSASIDVTGNIDVDDVAATTTVRVVASEGAIDVGNVTGPMGVTISGTDIDLTGTGGSVQSANGIASLTATAGDVSTTGLLDIDAGSIALAGAVRAGTGIDLDASAGGITSTGNMATTTGSADLRANNGTISLQGLNAPGGILVAGASIDYAGALVTQGQVFLEALTGALTGAGTSSVSAPNGPLTARALGGPATLNNVMIGGNLNVIGGSATMTGASMIGGTATIQALTGNVHVAGSVEATGGILLIEAPSGAAVINSIASNADVSLVVLDLDLTGTISAGDEFILTPAGTGRTIIIGGSGGTDGVTLRRPQGFTLDASEVTRIVASKLQINAGANDLALLDADFDPASLQSLFLGADSNAWIIAGGKVTGIPELQLGFVDRTAQARPELILVSGALGEDTDTGRISSLRLESSRDIVIGTQAFLDEFIRLGGNIDLATLGEPDLARFQGTRDHVFIAADQLRLFAPEEIVQLNTGTGFVGAGIVFREATAGDGTIVNAGGGPERVNLFGTVIRSSGERVTGFEAGLEPNLLGPGLSQNGELRLNLCVIGNSSSCSIAILREAQESARSRNSALSSLTNNTLFGFEDDEDDDEDEEDLGGVAGSGNEGLWGVGLP